MWTREDMRYVKDAPSISPVSYSTRVAPLPEDRVTAETEAEAEAEEEVGKKESVEGKDYLIGCKKLATCKPKECSWGSNKKTAQAS